MTTKKPNAPRAEYADKQVTPLILNFCTWLTEQTGYKVDPLSVYLGSALRGAFQKSPENQARLADQTQRVAAMKVAREHHKVAAPKAATPKPAPTKRAPVANGKTAPPRRRPTATTKGGAEA